MTRKWEMDRRGRGTEREPYYYIIFCEADKNGAAKVVLDTLNADFLYTDEERCAFCEEIVSLLNGELSAATDELAKKIFDHLSKGGFRMPIPALPEPESNDDDARIVIEALAHLKTLEKSSSLGKYYFSKEAGQAFSRILWRQSKIRDAALAESANWLAAQAAAENKLRPTGEARKIFLESANAIRSLIIAHPITHKRGDEVFTLFDKAESGPLSAAELRDVSMAIMPFLLDENQEVSDRALLIARLCITVADARKKAAP